MKRITAVLLAALMLLTLIPCGTGSAEGLALSGESVTIGDLALRPDGEAGRLYENEGLKLLVPLEYDDLLHVAVIEDPEDGTLFEVTEKASMEAAQAAGYEGAGAGWLFSIARIDEGARQDLLCYTDLSGAEIFAKDPEGMYYILRTPTDVRYVREDNEAMLRDQETWSALCAWAYASVCESFLEENPALTAVRQGRTELDLFLARIAYMPGMTYTVSTTQYGPLAPADGFDCAPWLEPLMSGIFEPIEGEAPDGEYVVLGFPEEGLRFDFFDADKDCVRQVWGEWEQLYRASFEDESIEATEIMQAWYDALAEEQGLAAGHGTMLGGWTLTEDGALTDEALGAFDKAMEGLVGVSYTPLALLGTQLVSGTNYCFLCEATVVYPGAQPYYALAYVYEDLQDGAVILNIIALDLGEIAESGEIKDAQPEGGPLLGGWALPEDTALTDEALGAFDQTMNGLVGVNYTPLALLGTQLVSGTNYCLLCEATVVYPNAEPYYALVYIYEDLQGGTELLNVVPMDLAALSQPAEA